VEGSTARVVTAIDVNALLGAPIFYMLKVSIDNGLTETSCVSNVSHSGPLVIRNGIEAADFLTARIVSEKLEVAGDVGFAFLLFYFDLFIGLGSGAVAATVLNNFFSCTKEARMSVKVDLAVVRLIPLGVQKQIFGVQQTIDSGSMILGTVRHSHGMVRSDFLLLNPFCDIIFLLIFDVSSHLVLISEVSMHSRSASFSTTLVHVRVSIRALRKLLENQEPG
jgi:hypothetical protein